MGMALSDSHYDYTRFEKEFDYSMLLFTRSIKRIKNELDIDWILFMNSLYSRG